MSIFLYYFLSVINILFMILMIRVIFKLLSDKEYRNYPPYLPSFGQEKKIIIKEVEQILKDSTEPKTIIDPGCGTATLLIALAKKFPNHNFVGIEWEKTLYLTCKFRARNLKNLSIVQSDMFEYSFKKADIIVCFLMDQLMERFGNKVKEDAKKNLVIFSNSFEIPNIPLNKKIETKRFFFVKNVYVYKDAF